MRIKLSLHLHLFFFVTRWIILFLFIEFFNQNISWLLLVALLPSHRYCDFVLFIVFVEAHWLVPKNRHDIGQKKIVNLFFEAKKIPEKNWAGHTWGTYLLLQGTILSAREFLCECLILTFLCMSYNRPVICPQQKMSINMGTSCYLFSTSINYKGSNKVRNIP